MIKLKKKKRVLSDKEVYFDSYFSQSKGLMFSSKKKDTGFVFLFKKPVRLSIHTFFVFYPITVVLLDENNNVLDINHMRPFDIFLPKLEFSKVVEFFKTPRELMIKKGDTFEFDEK